MRNILVAFYAGVIGVMILFIGFTIHGRNTRQVELNNALKSSMEEAMTILLYEEERPQTEEEWKAIFLQLLTVQINSTSELKVTILEADLEKGILSVEAVLTWYHPIGTKGSVSSIRTAVIEDYVE